MKTKKEIKAWLYNQSQLSDFTKDQIDEITNDVQKALKINPKRRIFNFEIGYIQLPVYRGLKSE